MHLLENGPRMRLALSLAANSLGGPEDWISMICEEHMYRDPDGTAAKKPKPSARNTKGGRNRELPPLFLPGFRGGIRSAPVEQPGPSNEFAVVEADAGAAFDVYIVEGYTPDVSLSSVRDMIARLRTSPDIAAVDLLSDDRVLPPTIPDVDDENVELDVRDMRRFVLRLELKRA